jgi:hypothetical protein
MPMSMTSMPVELIAGVRAHVAAHGDGLQVQRAQVRAERLGDLGDGVDVQFLRNHAADVVFTEDRGGEHGRFSCGDDSENDGRR